MPWAGYYIRRARKSTLLEKKICVVVRCLTLECPFPSVVPLRNRLLLGTVISSYAHFSRFFENSESLNKGVWAMS
jgi:hypothetical protein